MNGSSAMHGKPLPSPVVSTPLITHGGASGAAGSVGGDGGTEGCSFCRNKNHCMDRCKIRAKALTAAQADYFNRKITRERGNAAADPKAAGAGAGNGKKPPKKPKKTKGCGDDEAMLALRPKHLAAPL